MEEQNAEIISHETNISPVISNDMLLQVADNAERNIEAINKIKRLALRTTNARDWVEMGDAPYLEGSGAEKIARLFGISWRTKEPVFEQLEGGHYMYTYTGEFSMGISVIEAEGMRSSKDPFFTKYEYGDIDPETNKKKRIVLPPSEIDRGNVKMSAYTNMIANGVKRILGLRNLTWEDLAEAGITKEMVQRVEFKKSGTKPQSYQVNQDSQASGAQIDAINKILDTKGITDEHDRCERVSKIAKIEPIITKISSETLKKGQAHQIIDTLKNGG